MTRRRKRSRDFRYMLAFAIAGLALIILTTVAREIGWIIATAVIAALAFYSGRREGVKRGILIKKLAANSGYGKTSVREINAVSAYPAEFTNAAGDARTRRNGWTPPLRSQLLSRECASGEHIWCHFKGCACECEHVSQQPAVRKPIPDEPEY